MFVRPNKSVQVKNIRKKYLCRELVNDIFIQLPTHGRTQSYCIIFRSTRHNLSFGRNLLANLQQRKNLHIINMYFNS